MTISGPAVVAFAFFLATAERQGVAVGSARRHAADRHHQGVHRAEGMDLPAATAPAADRRPDGVLRRARARSCHPVSVSRLPHPRGGRDGGPGAGVHAGRRLRATSSSVSARGLDVDTLRLRAVVLLQRAHRLLRGDREVPRRSPHLGALAARSLRRHRSRRDDAPVPHADRRRVAHRAAADEQRGAYRGRGARRACSAGRSRSTRTRSTRCWPSRPRTPRSSRCARSR